jgi:hypothetical protein
MSDSTKDDPDRLLADEEISEVGWQAAVVRAYLTLVNRITVRNDQGTPLAPKPPGSNGSAT